MARKQTKARSRKPRTRKKARRRLPVSIGTLLSILTLALLLTATVSMLFYVIFFRVVVAAEIAGADVVPAFEEPLPTQVVGGDSEPAAATARPRYAVIVDDMGYHPEIGHRLIALPGALSFSFLPHAPHTRKLAAEAHGRGRPVLLHLPLEPQDAGWDPGEGALYLGETELQQRLFAANLARVPHAVGVNNHMGSRYTEDDAAMTSLLRLIGAAGLFYVDSYTSAASRGYELARRLKVPTARRHVFLDNELDVESICRQLEALRERAEKQGTAVGIAHPHPQTLTAFTSCLEPETARASLVGIDALVR